MFELSYADNKFQLPRSRFLSQVNWTKCRRLHELATFNFLIAGLGFILEIGLLKFYGALFQERGPKKGATEKAWTRVTVESRMFVSHNNGSRRLQTVTFLVFLYLLFSLYTYGKKKNNSEATQDSPGSLSILITRSKTNH